MGDHDHVLSRFYCGHDCLVPERHDSVDCCLEALDVKKNVPMCVGVKMGLRLCTFCRTLDVFGRFRRVQVEEYRMIFSKLGLAPFRAFRRFKVC